MEIRTTDKIVESVMWKLKTRSEVGITKYNTTLHDSTESTLAFLRHAQEEAMDLSAYLETLIQRLENQQK
jgi:hypothetical protein